MQYLLEVSKILDGAVRADRTKVFAYAAQLARKLEEEGNSKAAKHIRDCLAKPGSPELAANDMSPPARLPVDGESRLRLADEVAPAEHPPFIALPDVAKADVDRFVRYVTQADRLLARGVGISPSMLLYGPPGCGKTELAKHVAARLRLPILIARSDSLISSYLGSTAKNLRALFEHAMGRPSVLFLDEFDAFAKIRDDRAEMGELKRVVVSLLQNIDAMDGRTVLIAATNHEHLLDPAVWRRFAFKLHLVAPDSSQREQMFVTFLSGHVETRSEKLFAEASATLNGSQIRLICEDAIREAVLADRETVSEADVLRGIVRARLPHIASFTDPTVETLREIRSLSEHVFDGKRLSAIFSISGSTVSRRLKG